MKMFVMVLFLFSMCLAASPNAVAGAPTCQFSGASPYCQYSGKVTRVYINEWNTILLYFDTAMDLNQPTSVGYEGVTSANAAAYPLSDNPDFGKLLYASLLAAQARGATISVQMRNRHGGYLRIDRIWVYE